MGGKRQVMSRKTKKVSIPFKYLTFFHSLTRPPQNSNKRKKFMRQQGWSLSLHNNKTDCRLIHDGGIWFSYLPSIILKLGNGCDGRWNHSTRCTHSGCTFASRVVTKVKHINIEYNKFNTAISVHNKTLSLNGYTGIIR